MVSRKVRRIAVFALSLTLGILALQPAAAAQERGRIRSAVPGEISLHTLMANIMEIWRAVSAVKWNPGPPGSAPGNPPPGTNPTEGSGMCPNGGGPRPGPGQ